MLHQWMGCIDRMPPSCFLLDPACEEHLERSRERKGCPGIYLLFPYQIVTSCLLPLKSPNCCLALLLFLAPKSWAVPLQFLHVWGLVPLLNSSRIAQFECAISGSSKTPSDALRPRYPGIKTPVEHGGIDSHLNTLGEGKGPSKRLGADSSLGIPWGTFISERN